MASIDVQNEHQTGDNWSYDVRVEDGSRRFTFKVTLARSDYDSWSGGTVAPADVVRAAFEFLLDNEPATAIMASFDCSVIRRYFPHVDRELPRRLK